MWESWHAAAPLIHAAATVAMAGVIWFVQVVHYPLFERVAPERFVEFESAHRRRTTWVVAPLMLAELATAVSLALRPPAGVWPWAPRIGLALLVLVWLSTFAVQVPLHEKLSRGFDAAVHRRLVRGNWVRTVAWSARAAVALGMLPGH